MREEGAEESSGELGGGERQQPPQVTAARQAQGQGHGRVHVTA